jgi:hypothetical protein
MPQHAIGLGENEIGRKRHQLLRIKAHAFRVGAGVAIIDPDVLTVSPAEFLQPVQKCRGARALFRIILGESHERANAPHPLALLPARRQRP